MQVVVLYDWLLSLPRETQLFFSRSARVLSSLLYFTNRYLTIVCTIVTFVSSAPFSNQVCCFTLLGRLFADSSSTRCMFSSSDVVKRGIVLPELTLELFRCERLLIAIGVLDCLAMIPFASACLGIQGFDAFVMN